jgi:anti-sigma-K factor RskA
MGQPSEIHTLAGAYALDALTEIERAGFARHLASCEACAVEVAELSETASRLGAAAWEAPPPGLRTAVLSEVTRTRQVPARRDEPATRDEFAVRRWRRWTAAAVAAGVVAIGGVATTVVIEERRVDQIAAEQARLTAVLAAGDATVRSADVTGGGRVTVAMSPSLDQGVVLVSQLPEPPAGKAYQLWLITGNSPASVGVMAAGQRDGTVALDSLGTADTLGVTVEPEGGSDQPTSDPIAGVPLV